MEKIQVTLTVTLQQLQAIISLLDTTPSESHTEPPGPKVSSEGTLVVVENNELPASTTTTPTAGKVTKMPGFGRTQTQIDSFAKDEEVRVEKKTIEQAAKDERAKERKIKKDAKDLIEQETKDKTIKEEEEVETIKQTVTDEVVTSLIKKPWEL